MPALLSAAIAATTSIAFFRDPPFETPSPGPSPHATATPSPGPTGNRTYEYVLEPSAEARPAGPDDPVILKVELNRRRYSSHDELQMMVLTTTNVVRVTNYEMGRGGKLRLTAPGVFEAEGTVPSVPFFLTGTKIDLHFKAATADGKTTAFTVPVTF